MRMMTALVRRRLWSSQLDMRALCVRVLRVRARFRVGGIRVGDQCAGRWVEEEGGVFLV